MASQVLSSAACPCTAQLRLAQPATKGVRSVRVLGITPLRPLRVKARAICRAQVEKHTSDVEEECVSSVVTPQEEDALEKSAFYERALLAVASMATPLLLTPEASWAKDGEFGLLEGRTAALVHPAVMFILFASSLYAGYLGYQWRRVREVGTQISDLKKQLPEGAAAETSPIAAQVATLTVERKVLVEGGYRDKHWLAGSWLLAAGVGIAVEGCVNTYMRTGRLFPGPHLYAGALITVLWAAAAALVPAMQKGNDTARTAHIALNVANVLLFVSQIPTGLEIVGKVFEFTVWP